MPTVLKSTDPLIAANFDPAMTPEQMLEKFARAVVKRRIERATGGGMAYLNTHGAVLRLARSLVRHIDDARKENADARRPEDDHD